MAGDRDGARCGIELAWREAKAGEREGCRRPGIGIAEILVADGRIRKCALFSGGRRKWREFVVDGDDLVVEDATLQQHANTSRPELRDAINRLLLPFDHRYGAQADAIGD